MKSILKIGTLSLLVAAIAAAPTQLTAQSTNAHATDHKSTSGKSDAGTKKAAHPFRGKLAGVDKTAKTIKVGESTYQITSTTKITKDGKPATLEDGVVGQPVSGYVKPAASGALAATTVTFGGKPAKR
jgi:starvation-inducible outer membrane lipoprotein